MSATSAYPPERHLLRDLDAEFEVVGATEHRAHLGQGSAGSFGAVATVVDVLGGSLCLQVVAPDWIATSTLTLRCAALPDDAGLVIDARLLRAGRRHVSVEATLRSTGPGGSSGSGGPGTVLGDALVGFTRLERREGNLDLAERTTEAGSRFRFDRLVDVPRVPFDAGVGGVVLDATSGVTETPVRPYVQNSFGAVNGGVVAAIATRAATVAAAAAGSTGVRVAAVEMHHLGQGREGPVRTRVDRVADDGDRHLWRVEVVDAGLLDDRGSPRLMAVAHVALVALSACGGRV